MVYSYNPILNFTGFNQGYLIYVTATPGSRILLLLHYVQTFSSWSHFDTSALNDNKMTLNTKRSKCPIYMLQLPLSPKLHSFLIYSQTFSNYRPFERSALNDTKMIWNTKRLMVPHYKYTRVLNFTPFRSTETSIRVTGHFGDKCTEWPQNHIEH